MIRGQLEPFSDPSSALLCIPALAPLAERLMVSCIYKLLPQTLSFKAMQIVHIQGRAPGFHGRKRFHGLGSGDGLGMIQVRTFVVHFIPILIVITLVPLQMVKR